MQKPVPTDSQNVSTSAPLAARRAKHIRDYKLAGVIDWLKVPIKFYTCAITGGMMVRPAHPTKQSLTKAALSSFWEQRAELNCLHIQDFDVKQPFPCACNQYMN
jgi:hypothetical protein